jgi:hypothetical protein
MTPTAERLAATDAPALPAPPASPDPTVPSASPDPSDRAGTPAPPPPPAGTARRGDREADGSEPASRFSLALGLLFWLGVGIAVALNDDGARPVVLAWWWLGALATLAVVVVLLVPSVQRRLARLTPARRAGLFIFVVMPLVVLAVTSVAALPAAWQTVALRTVFVVVVCLLPAAMWYLFIANQKASLLNEYLTNLERLGLLRRRRQPGGRIESEAARQVRVSGYLRKFEAVYGPLDPGVLADVIAGSPRVYSRSAADATTPLATTTVPVLLSTVLVTLGWLVTLPFQVPDPDLLFPGGDRAPVQWARALSPVSTPETFAFLGAYFFSLQMIFRRYVQKDLHGSAYVAASMRLVLAVIGTWVLARLGGDVLWSSGWELLTLAFLVGVFPRVLWQILQTLATRIGGIAVPSLRAGQPLIDLAGLTVWHESRLEEEDIENVPNMATADIPSLLVSTPYSPERLVDWVDEAILRTQLDAGKGSGAGSALAELRTHGIRTASALVAAARSAGAAEVHRALDGRGRPGATEALLAALARNQNLELVLAWRGPRLAAETRVTAVRTLGA